MHTYIFFFLLFLLSSIKSIDIKLSLGKKLETSGYYPLVVTLIEPWIYETNPIDLFCVFDVSGSQVVWVEKRDYKI